MSLTRSRIFPLIAVLALAIPLSGCGTLMMIATAPIVAEGMWRDWKKKTLIDIEREAHGEAAPKYCGGTWYRCWHDEIKPYNGWEQRRVDFIITQRRARGLPEL